MTSVFEQARAEVRRHGMIRYAAFAARELSGLVRDAFRAQMESAPTCREPWVWSLEAPVVAILLYAFCVWRAEEMGMWGFFFPGTYVVVIALGALGAWIVGRECTVVRRWHRWRRAAIVFVIAGLSVPIAARGMESAWARYLLARDTGFTFYFPGVQVVVADDLPDQSQRRGLTFTRSLTHADGRTMMMLQYTNEETPPYVFLGALAVAALALKSRREARIEYGSEDGPSLKQGAA